MEEGSRVEVSKTGPGLLWYLCVGASHGVFLPLDTQTVMHDSLKWTHGWVSGAYDTLVKCSSIHSVSHDAIQSSPEQLALKLIPLETEKKRGSDLTDI
ncbi:Hypothetical predicted protein [Scomber scombrus]|uniref:Uncharacterized protein n=1 Tax=Scomber scombrus TaxID=13677 RepID=A0AAV1PUF7_SCOSC